MKYKIEYNFDGVGYAIIDAKNEIEAIDKFNEGECVYNDQEPEGSIEIASINKINK